MDFVRNPATGVYHRKFHLRFVVINHGHITQVVNYRHYKVFTKLSDSYNITKHYRLYLMTKTYQFYE